MINLEHCGVEPVNRGIALGFERVANGKDAKIIKVSMDLFISCSGKALVISYHMDNTIVMYRTYRCICDLRVWGKYRYFPLKKESGRRTRKLCLKAISK